MPTVVLCCNTLEDELRLAVAEAGLDYPVVWVEAGLHNQIARLRGHLVEILSNLDARRQFDERSSDGGPARVLMALGHCGGACCELGPFNFELIMPKTDDCLSFLMGSMANRQEVSRMEATYFLTAGWLRHSDNLVASFERDRKLFGPELVKRIYKIMLNHYRSFGFVETGAYDPDVQMEKIRPLAELLSLKTERLAADRGWLRRFLTGPWDQAEFMVLPPGRILGSSDWNWLTQVN